MKSIVLLTLIFFTTSSSAKISAYLGAAQNYGSLGAARIGFDEWEIGQFAPVTYGANKLFTFSETYYATLGFGLTAPFALAIMSGFGFNWGEFLGFGLRGELYTVTSTSGNLDGAGVLGASWNF